jgi:hypothetical protein
MVGELKHRLVLSTEIQGRKQRYVFKCYIERICTVFFYRWFNLCGHLFAAESCFTRVSTQLLWQGYGPSWWTSGCWNPLVLNDFCSDIFQSSLVCWRGPTRANTHNFLTKNMSRISIYCKYSSSFHNKFLILFIWQKRLWWNIKGPINLSKRLFFIVKT